MSKLLLGTKIYKENEDDFDIYRIIRTYGPEKFKIRNEKTKEDIKITQDELINQKFKALQPNGIITFSVVDIGKNKDVVITFVKYIDIKAGMSVPSVICRQSVTDFFYNLLAETEDHGYVGVSVSDKTCPSNIEYGELLACDGISFSEVVNMYYDDTIDSIMQCISVTKYDDVLYSLYEKHVKATGNQTAMFKSVDSGWCKSIKTLMEINNFWIDVDAALNISDVDFELSEHIIEKKDEANKEYYSLDNEVLRFLSNTFKLNMVDSIIIEYGYDIDLGEYRNENYALLRSNSGKLYLVVYLLEGTYLEQDIAIKEEQENLSRQFGLKIVNKYNQSKSN